MKKLSLIIALVCAMLLITCSAMAEATDEEIMGRLIDYGNQINEELELGASDINWQYIYPTDDPKCWLLAVGTTDNGKTIVLAQGERVLDNSVRIYGTWLTNYRSQKTEAPEAIGEACLFESNITAWAFDGAIDDGRYLVNVKKAWGWFEDGRLISGDRHNNGNSYWIDLGCHHRFNKVTGELREKAIHSYKLIGGYPASCYKTGLAIYECTRCGCSLTTIRPLSHHLVTYNGYGTFCTKCGQKIY